jgi:hypothetical protein
MADNRLRDIECTAVNSDTQRIYDALDDLMQACGLSGESGSETLFHALSDATKELDFSIVEQSHRDGLCYDVNALLADGICAWLYSRR